MDAKSFDLFMSFMHDGGPIMWVILALSIVGCAIALERLIFFAAASRRPFSPGLDDGEKTSLGGLGGEAFQSERGDAALAGAEYLSVLAERSVRSEIFDWQRNLSLLEVIIRAAPMLGLLGTVLGMAEMFRVLASSGAGIDSGAVTEGIREALFTTIAGLCCAVPLLVADGILNAIIDRHEEKLNRQWDEFIRQETVGKDGQK